MKQILFWSVLSLIILILLVSKWVLLDEQISEAGVQEDKPQFSHFGLRDAKQKDNHAPKQEFFNEDKNSALAPGAMASPVSSKPVPLSESKPPKAIVYDVSVRMLPNRFAPRAFHAMAVHNNRLWLLGGCDASRCFDELLVSDDGLNWGVVDTNNESSPLSIWNNTLSKLKKRNERQGLSPPRWLNVIKRLSASKLALNLTSCGGHLQSQHWRLDENGEWTRLNVGQSKYSLTFCAANKVLFADKRKARWIDSQNDKSWLNRPFSDTATTVLKPTEMDVFHTQSLAQYMAVLVEQKQDVPVRFVLGDGDFTWTKVAFTPALRHSELLKKDEQLHLLGYSKKGLEHWRLILKNAPDNAYWEQQRVVEPPPVRQYARFVYFKNRYWLFGGLDDKQRVGNDIWVSDTGASWSLVK